MRILEIVHSFKGSVSRAEVLKERSHVADRGGGKFFVVEDRDQDLLALSTELLQTLFLRKAVTSDTSKESRPRRWTARMQAREFLWARSRLATPNESARRTE